MDRTLSPVLILNASFEPVFISSARRALKLLAKGAAHLEESQEHFVRRDVKLPSVIRLLCYHRVPVRKQILSRKNILLRDCYTCQYCNIQFAPGKLTLDHVIPRAQKGSSTWENMVAACHPCNHKKRNRTPEEAGLKLLRPPRPLTIHTHRQLLRTMGVESEQWRKYLYY